MPDDVLSCPHCTTVMVSPGKDVSHVLCVACEQRLNNPFYVAPQQTTMTVMQAMNNPGLVQQQVTQQQGNLMNYLVMTDPMQNAGPVLHFEDEDPLLEEDLEFKDDVTEEDIRHMRMTKKVADVLAVVGFVIMVGAAFYPILFGNGSSKTSNPFEIALDTLVIDLFASACFSWVSLWELIVEIKGTDETRKAWGWASIYIDLNWILLLLWNRSIQFRSDDCSFSNGGGSDGFGDGTGYSTSLSMVSIFGHVFQFFLTIKAITDPLSILGFLVWFKPRDIFGSRNVVTLLKEPVVQATPSFFFFTKYVFIVPGVLSVMATGFMSLIPAIPSFFKVKKLRDNEVDTPPRRMVAYLFAPILISTVMYIILMLITAIAWGGCNLSFNTDEGYEILVYEVFIGFGWAFLNPWIKPTVLKLFGFKVMDPSKFKVKKKQGPKMYGPNGELLDQPPGTVVPHGGEEIVMATPLP